MSSKRTATRKHKSASRSVATVSVAAASVPSDNDIYVALDCEMVGVGEKGRESVLGEVSILNWDGVPIYHSYVTPPKDKPVTDYRKQFSGLTEEKLKEGKPFLTVQKEVRAILKGKIVVGHALDNDFRALKLPYIPAQTRNTAHHPAFQQDIGHAVRDGVLVPQFGPRKLKVLAKMYLDKNIQTGDHDPTEDARAALDIFKAYRYVFEPSTNIQNLISQLQSVSLTSRKTRKQARKQSRKQGRKHRK
jgi:RNA exonuclease 4